MKYSNSVLSTYGVGSVESLLEDTREMLLLFEIGQDKKHIHILSGSTRRFGMDQDYSFLTFEQMLPWLDMNNPYVDIMGKAAYLDTLLPKVDVQRHPHLKLYPIKRDSHGPLWVLVKMLYLRETEEKSHLYFGEVVTVYDRSVPSHVRLFQTNHYDGETHLKNRKALKKWVINMHETLSYGLFVDLDNFKKLNDTYGHRKGDIVLKTIAKQLKQFKAPGTEIYRIGGDEFFIILTKSTLEAAKTLAKQIIETIDATRIKGVAIPLSASIGVGPINTSAKGLHGVLNTIDAAMYEAKNKGRGKLYVMK